MANLRGILQGNRGETSRLASQLIYSVLNTWHGKIETTLDKDGNATVNVNGKQVWTGNINRGS